MRWRCRFHGWRRSRWRFSFDSVYYLVAASILTGVPDISESGGFYRIDQLAPPPAYHSAGSAANNTLVGDIALKQQLTGDVMSYVSYSRGYSPAAYNTSANLTSNASLVPVSRENIDSFEIGIKGSYLDRRVILNADVFDSIYRDYQIQSYSYAPGVLSPPLTLASAGRAETRGLEVLAEWLATPTTRLTLQRRIH